MGNLLTDKEMARVQGDKDACLAVIDAFGDCKGCSAGCHKIAKAQYDKDNLPNSQIRNDERRKIKALGKGGNNGQGS